MDSSTPLLLATLPKPYATQCKLFYSVESHRAVMRYSRFYPTFILLQFD